MRLRPKVRLDVLSGFLGSGKTTLLRRCLAALEPNSRVAVMINEFGEVSIDHRLIRTSVDSPRALPSGCACCTVADQLRESLLELLREDAGRESNLFDRIILETSGLADPATILNTIRCDLALAEYLEVGRCVVAFDALDGAQCAEQYPELLHQLVAADAVVITKTDLSGSAAMKKARAFVRGVSPFAEIAISSDPEFQIATLFSGKAPTSPEALALPRHAGSIRSFCLTLHGPVDWASFSVWLTGLLHRHGMRILRFKALLDLGPPQGLLVIHGVRHLVYPPEHLSGMADGRSDLVFIVDGLGAHEIDASLRRFLAFAESVTKHTAIGVVSPSRRGNLQIRP